MARKVFFSFHYGNDINRSMVVRNSWVTQDKDAAGFIDKAEFETIKRQGERAVHNLIDRQLNGTSVTVVLIGSEMLTRPFVCYEICRSLYKGNGIIGVYIHNIKDMVTGDKSAKGNIHTVIGYNNRKEPLYFDEICDGIYDYIDDNGYDNLGYWVERATAKHG